MRMVLFKCDWCPTEARVLDAQPPGWVDREGQKPAMVKDNVQNIKWYEPCGVRKLHFCSDKCNQAAKATEAASLEAANKAWVRVYNERHA